MARAGSVHKPKASTTVAEAYVGRCIRAQRIMCGMTQKNLGDILGMSHQQVHKLERGVCRVSSAALLWELARALDVSVDYFFKGLGQEPVQTPSRKLLEMAQNFAAIPDEKHQEAFAQTVRLMTTSLH